MITTSCTCRERFVQNGFGCELCPVGTRPSLDNRSCVSLECQKDQIFRSDLLCPQCEWCPAGSLPDPTRTTCIIQPRPSINVGGVPSCSKYQIFNLDRTECIPCPNGSLASEDNNRCLNSCSDPLDILRQDGSCFTCCNGNVPDESRTRCVKATNTNTGCTGDREIYNSDRTACEQCRPYTRAQRGNSVCLSDTCGQNQIITWLGTCADCDPGLRPDTNRGTCVAPGSIRLNAQLIEEPVEEVSSTATKKEKSFPTIIVAGLGILIMVLSAVTGMICLRGREKTNTHAVEAQEQPAQEAETPRQNDLQSIEHMVGEQQPKKVAPAEVMEKIQEEGGEYTESGSAGKSSE